MKHICRESAACRFHDRNSRKKCTTATGTRCLLSDIVSNLFPQRDVPFFQGEANMKLSLPNNSIRSCLLALAAVLILPMPASYADTVLTANLTGLLEIPSSGSTA